MNTVTKGIAPEVVLGYFEEISAIPRGSGNEEGIANYLVDFAKKRDLFVVRDAMHNVFIRKSASAGSEAKPAVLLQGHSDIVCEKNAGVEHDFLTDPIDLYVDGDWLKARGTTLGADNGIAVAYMLAALDDKALKHPTMECLFTSMEEVGLDGAQFFDASVVTAKTMINLDCGPEGVAVVSCAGGMRIDMSLMLNQIPFAGEAIKISVTGLAGGHSGGLINQYLGNSNKIMARILSKLQEPNIIHIEGGSKDNAIPRECFATIAVAHAAEAKKIIEKMAQIIATELGPDDSAFAVTVENAPVPKTMGDRKDSTKLWQLMCIAPNGVQAMSHDIEGLVDASLNMGVVVTDGATVTVSFSPRASMESMNDETRDRLTMLAEVMGFESVIRSRYPGWAYAKESPIRDLAMEVYKEMTGKEMTLKATHGGLECGILKSKIDGLDVVAIGPDATGAHSPDEQLNLPSANRVWLYLKELLAKLA